MNLFLDTNVYLSFYKLPDADLEQLTQLVDAVRSSAVSLFVTEQVRDEFYRGREKTIADSLRPVEVEKFGHEFPAPFRNFPGFEELSNTLDAYGRQRSALFKEVRQAALEKRLHADGLIRALFDLANGVRMTPDVLAAAQQRMDLGNPPGKRGSYGDAVNWESLLGAIPDGEDLFLVTADADYLSPLDPSVISDFLHDEWSRRKHGNVTLYSALRAFLSSTRPKGPCWLLAGRSSITSLSPSERGCSRIRRDIPSASYRGDSRPPADAPLWSLTGASTTVVLPAER